MFGFPEGTCFGRMTSPCAARASVPKGMASSPIETPKIHPQKMPRKPPNSVLWRYCVNFDDDDLYATVYVERMVNELRQNRGCSVLQGRPTFWEVLLTLLVKCPFSPKNPGESLIVGFLHFLESILSMP